MTNSLTIILIDSPDAESSAEFADQLKEHLLHIQRNTRIYAFPSEGIIGHQLRVVEQGRYELEKYPLHALRLIDRMDLYFNPQFGIHKNGGAFDSAIIIGNFVDEYELTKGSSETTDWVRAINTILPSPAIIIPMDCNDNQVAYLHSVWPSAQIQAFPKGSSIESVLEKIGRSAS